MGVVYWVTLGGDNICCWLIQKRQVQRYFEHSEKEGFALRVKPYILKWTTIFSGIVFLIFPYSNFGKSTTSFGDSALYLVALYTPQTINKTIAAQGGSDDLLDVEAQIFDNTFMPLTLPSHAPSRRSIATHEVQEGETLQGIAQNAGLKLNTVLWANGLSTTSRLKPGQSLNILPVDGVIHRVKKGETLGSLSLVYKVYTESIIDVNNLSSQGLIIAGQDLIIPGASPLPAPKPAIKGKAGSISGEPILVDLRGALVNPAPGAHRSQGLHWRNAVDLANSCGAPIVAAAGGTVIKADAAGWNGGFGKYIIIQHAGGYTTVYGHLSQVGVSVGQAVGQGARIGLVGSTGHATGCHVHFEVRGGVNPFTR